MCVCIYRYMYICIYIHICIFVYLPQRGGFEYEICERIAGSVRELRVVQPELSQRLRTKRGESKYGG